MSSIQAIDNRARWARRQASLRGEAYDEAIDGKVKSQAALDTLWKDGRGSLTELQWLAGDWLRCLAVGDDRERKVVKIVVDFGRTPDAAAVGAVDRDMMIEAALHAVGKAAPSYQNARNLLEWTCVYEYALSDIARKIGRSVGVEKFHHETAKRQIGAALEYLADYKFGCDADRDAWNAKAALR